MDEKPPHIFIAKNSSNKIIHVTNLPNKGYTDQDILKLAEPFGKVCDVLIIRSKNEAFIETNFKEAAAAAVKYSESNPVRINKQQVTLSIFGHKKTYGKSLEEDEPEEPAESAAQPDLPPGFIKCYMLEDPPLKHEDKCVVLVSNLPDFQCNVDEITNLAKPFGGVTDVLVVSTHKEVFRKGYRVSSHTCSPTIWTMSTACTATPYPHRSLTRTKILAHKRAQKSGPASVPHPLAHQSLSVWRRRGRPSAPWTSEIFPRMSSESHTGVPDPCVRARLVALADFRSSQRVARSSVRVFHAGRERSRRERRSEFLFSVHLASRSFSVVDFPLIPFPESGEASEDNLGPKLNQIIA
ncbi:unnamed protein product [Ranitomeya imitator]|uniref:RRM domain-containing protein n=1 Tax=Ranitomeya imitator TaxID=111125 RepID=A0ABN9LNZ7_9NEOB|nr:unnamed protein product [Ranitomeya imitator]